MGNSVKNVVQRSEPVTPKQKETPISSENTSNTKKDNISIWVILIVIIGVIAIIYAY